MKKMDYYPAPYQTYVQALCLRYPSLNNLSEFLSSSTAPSRSSRLVTLDFQKGLQKPIIREDVSLDRLSHEIRGSSIIPAEDIQGEKNHESDLLGRVLIIEDLTRDLIELLGSELDIDPLFFAMHLHTAHRRGMRTQTPDEATLPSRIPFQSYTNVSYHRTVTSDTVDPHGERLLRDTVIDRKLVFLRSTTVGLAQHCASILRVKRKGCFWISLIIVDPAIGDTFYCNSREHNKERIVKLRTQPFLGAYEDFLGPIPFSKFSQQGKGDLRGGMLRELIYYWSRSSPACFDPTDPSLQSLAYYPLRIVAAEWVKYVAVMQYCIKQYEYQHDRLPELERFNKDLRELQGWRRRSMMSKGKVRSILRLLKSNERGCQDLEALIEDYELISTKIEEAGRRLENMLPVVMTLVQIADARRSFAETADISRLTVLALVFVPLTFVASLFSMNTETMPGSKDFWIYFAVAVPVTLLVVLVARPPITRVKEFVDWLNARRLRSKPLRHDKFEISIEKETEA